MVGSGLLTLPPHVHLLLTSRPEQDIEAHLKQLNPFTVDKYDAEQRADLRLFARRRVIEATSLRDLTKEQQEAALDELVDRADGVFLAMRFCAEHLLTKAAESKGGELGIADVRAIPPGVVDNTYRDSLKRVWARVREVESMAKAVGSALATAMRRTLAVLVASVRPLNVVELSALCAGKHAQDPLLTETLLGALSLLFTMGAVGAAVEPLHKTVYDFLLDPSRSGELAVASTLREDGRRVPYEGHAVLAIACARELGAVFEQKAASPAEWGGAERYALEYGHVHLGEAAEVSLEDTKMSAVDRQAGRDLQLEASTAWCALLLEERPERELALAGLRHRRSDQRATAAAGKWVLAHAELGRSRLLRVELQRLGQHRQRGVRELWAMMRVTAWVLSQSFAPYYTAASTAKVAGLFDASPPCTSTWTLSPGSELLWRHLSSFRPGMRRLALTIP